MACVGYLLAGLPPHTQSARRGRLRSAYDTFFVPVRAVLQNNPTAQRLGHPRKLVCDVAHTASPTHSKPTNVWGTRGSFTRVDKARVSTQNRGVNPGHRTPGYTARDRSADLVRRHRWAV